MNLASLIPRFDLRRNGLRAGGRRAEAHAAWLAEQQRHGRAAPAHRQLVRATADQLADEIGVRRAKWPS